MIIEAGVGVKALITGGGIVSGIALIAGMTGGARVAETSADHAKLAAAVCSYTDQPLSKMSALSMRRALPSATAASGKRSLSREQLAHARIIVDTATALGLPQRAAVIGIATALQESNLKNDVVGDHGTAFGIFQQHPASGWGTKAEVTDPGYAARRFFSVLVKVKDWQAQPLTVAAQTVQKSAFPDAYAKHEPRAVEIVAALWPSDGQMSTLPRPRKAPLAEGAGKALGVTPAELSAVRSSIEAAGSLGIDRKSVVADVSHTRLDATRSGASTIDPETSWKLAEQIVTTVADQLCRELRDELSTAVGQAEGVTGASARAMTAVQAALKMLGVPYSWGGGGAAGASFGIGRGAKTKGFDCSGLTQYAWAKAGVSIPRVTYSQWNHGSRVRGAIQPGDLVFYETNARIPGPDHVGLAISGTKMVHAPRTGTVIHIAPIRRSGYVGAVRPGQQ
jgi:cell wall-associated NlpC family hydrolase